MMLTKIEITSSHPNFLHNICYNVNKINFLSGYTNSYLMLSEYLMLLKYYFNNLNSKNFETDIRDEFECNGCITISDPTISGLSKIFFDFNKFYEVKQFYCENETIAKTFINGMDQYESVMTDLDYIFKNVKYGNLVILQHPENNLHPSKSVNIVNKIVEMYKNGVQIFLNSQCDHIFNQLRLSVAKGDVNQDDVNILYYNKEGIPISDMRIDNRGRLNWWEDGFFDQYENFLDELLEY